MKSVGQYNQEKHIQTDFDDFSLFKPLALFFLSTLLVLPLPWAVCHLNRIMVGGMFIPGMGRLQFDGKPLDRAVLFYTLSHVFSWLPIFAGETPLAHPLYLVSWVLSAASGYVFLQWLYAHISVSNIPIHMRFTGKIPAYLGLTLLVSPPFFDFMPDTPLWLWGSVGICLLSLGFLTKLWWWWLFNNLSGPVKLSLTASVWDLSWRIWLVIASIPFILPTIWSFSWFTNWFICQIGIGNQGVGGQASHAEGAGTPGSR